MTRFTLPILIATLTLAAPAAHSASDDGEVPEKLVRYDDLNVNGPAGAARLFQRLRSASKDVCRPLDGRGPHHAPMYRKCVAKALSQAVAKVDVPALTTYYRESLGGRNQASTAKLADR